MANPSHLRYSTDHEWVETGTDAPVKVGVSAHAASELGDVVYVDLPAVGTQVTAGATCGEIESTKSVAEIFSPVTGTVVAVNDDLADHPELVNSDPYGAGWLLSVDAESWGEDLLDAAGYASLVGADGEEA